MGLKQFGGEGKEKYKGNKNDSKLSQHGGEGKSFGKKGQDINFTPSTKPGVDYTGAGRNLKTESN